LTHERNRIRFRKRFRKRFLKRFRFGVHQTPQHWEGLMGQVETLSHRALEPALSPWSGAMIAPLCDAGYGSRASFVAKTFSALPGDQTASLRISAQGLYRAFVNGSRVGNDVLTPGLTCYDDRIAYQTYDITALVQAGENRIEIWLSDGWFRSAILWPPMQIENCWGDRIAAIAEISQAGRILVKTDQTWKSGLLPITRAGIYYGEDYDARLENAPAHDGVEVLAFDAARLVPHEADPVVELPALAPVKSWADAEGRQVLDFGQNVAGYVRIAATGPAGAHIRVEHAEVLGPDGVFDNRNFRSARAEAHLTLNGGSQNWSPQTTFMGFRYARITASGGAVVSDAVSVPISSIPRATGDITTGHPAVNRLVQNTLWSMRANFVEIPTDCPQRDERLGWSGDAQVFAGTACWLGEVDRFLRKYLRDLRHDQRADGAIAHFSPDPTRLHQDKIDGVWAGSTGWGDAITVIPWQLYLHYGDKTVLEENFPAMLRWIDYLWNISDGPVIRPSAVWGAHGFSFGDWLQPTGPTVKPRPTIADDCAATIYHFISTEIAAKTARALGRVDEAQALMARAEVIRTAFQDEYFSRTGRIAHNDQTSWSLAFLYGLVPAEHYEAGKTHFRRIVEEADGLIGTGFIGTPALLPALTLHGMADLAEKILLNRKVPGWLYQVDRGATSIWERWDAIGEDGSIFTPEMNSYNHYAYGAVCQWLFESVAGVAPRADAPGFDVITIDPLILPALSPVAMWHDCRHGRIEAGWTLNGNNVTYRLSLPPGSSAILSPKAAKGALTVNGQPGQIGQHLPSGTHEISFHI
jgi:alpha-L-rhamnosidase